MAGLHRRQVGPAQTPKTPKAPAASTSARPMTSFKRSMDESKPLFPLMTLATNYVIASSRKNRRAFCVGVMTVSLVVGFATFLAAVVQSSPLVFMRLAEDQTGDADMILLPEFGSAALAAGATSNAVQATTTGASSGGGGGATSDTSAASSDQFEFATGGLGLLNSSDVAHLLRDNADVAGVAPRFLMLARMFHPDFPERNTTSFVLVIDSKAEDAAGIGRNWGRRRLGEQEVYASDTVLLELGVRPNYGERMRFNLDVVDFLGTSGLLPGGAGNLEDPESARQALADLGIEFATTVPVDADAAVQAVAAAFGFTGPLPFTTGVGTVDVDTSAVFDAVYPALRSALVIDQEVIVLDSVDDPGGKWPPLLGNVVVMEMDYAAQLVREAMDAALAVIEGAQVAPGLGGLIPGAAGDALLSLNDAIVSARVFVDSIDVTMLRENAMQVIVQYTGRSTSYVKDDVDLKTDMIAFSDSVFEDLNPSYPATPSLPLASALAGTIFIRLFLDQIFNAVVGLLTLLGVLVIYALVLGDVEEKTYEYGMLRALGMRHRLLARVLGVQSTFFSIPGLIIGFIIAAVLHAATMWAIALFLVIDVAEVPLGLDVGSIVYGLILGIVMPALANVIPIRRALSKTLRDALDMYHKTFSEVTVRMMRLAEIGLSPAQTTLSLMMVIIGFVTYYLLPLAFVFRNFALFLGILNSILLGMLLGLSLVSQALQAATEHGVLWAMLWGRERRMSTVISKNLAGHRDRNRKTAYMISISVAFVLFAGVMFNLQAAQIATTVKLVVGGDLLVWSPLRETPLPQQEMTEYLKTAVQPVGDQPALVEDFTFVTYRLDQTAPASQTRFSNLAMVPEPRGMVFGVQKNYLNVAYKEFEIVSESVPVEGPDLTPEQVDAANADVVAMLHAGRGELRLPIEGGDTGGGAGGSSVSLVPPPIVIGSRVRPLYVCNMSDVEGVEPQDLWTPTGGIAGDGGPSRKAYEAVSAQITAGAIPAYQWSWWCDSACGVKCIEMPSFNVTRLAQQVTAAYEDYVDVIMSEALRVYSSADTTVPMMLRVRATDEETGSETSSIYMAKARAMVAKMPGFFFSTYSQTGANAQVLVSMESFARMVLQAEDDAAFAAANNLGSERELRDSLDEQEDDSDPQARFVVGNFGNPVQVPSSVATNATFQWAESSPSWTQGTTDGSNDIPGGGEWVSEGGAGGVNEGVNATFALDNNPSTRLQFFTDDPSWFVMDIGVCAAVGGVRLYGTGTVGDVREWDLFAAPEPVGPWRLVASGVAGTEEEGVQPRWHEFVFAPFSGQYWRFEAKSNYGWTAGTVLADLQFFVADAERCDADLALINDEATFVPKQRLMIRLPDGASFENRQRVLNGLRNTITSDIIRIEDTAELVESTETAALGLQVFFNVVAAVALVLCFFASWLSFTANIRENSREFGVLRALGFSVPEVMRIYVYESLSVVMASFTLGTVVGILVAVSLTLQFNLFLENPFVLEFPWFLFVFTLVMSIVVAVVSSLWPARSLAKMMISNVLKGNKPDN